MVLYFMIVLLFACSTTGKIHQQYLKSNSLLHQSKEESAANCNVSSVQSAYINKTEEILNTLIAVGRNLAHINLYLCPNNDEILTYVRKFNNLIVNEINVLARYPYLISAYNSISVDDDFANLANKESQYANLKIQCAQSLGNAIKKVTTTNDKNIRNELFKVMKQGVTRFSDYVTKLQSVGDKIKLRLVGKTSISEQDAKFIKENLKWLKDSISVAGIQKAINSYDKIANS